LAKKKRQKRISPSAEGDHRYARWISGRFLKKATQKLSSKLTACSPREPLNPNLFTTAEAVL